MITKMSEKLEPIGENRAKIYEFKIERPLTQEEKRAMAVFRRLKKAGFESYFVGGGVRDELMGNPAHDIDIATSATPEEIENIFPKAFDRGRSFGVMAVKSGDHEFEVATFRSDIGIFDHRRPQKVEFTSAEEDAKRRDFTINGLFFNPDTGQVIDYVGGMEDLEGKIVRFIGDPQERIDEDYLRMLRAIRFVNRFGFVLDQKAGEAIRTNAEKITQVSNERIRDELSKMLVSKNRVLSVELLDQLGLLEKVIPELLTMKGVDQPPEFHGEGDVWTHTMLALKELPADSSPELAWTVLLHDIGKPETRGEREHPKSKITFFEHDVKGVQMAEQILRRLKFANDFIEKVKWAISQHMRLIHAFREMSERKKKKLFLDPNIGLLLESTRADLLASIPTRGQADLSMYEEALKLKAKYEQEMSEAEKEQVQKFTLITGHDIMEALGIPSGPKVGEIKSKIEQAYLDGRISTREEAIKLIKDYPKS